MDPRDHLRALPDGLPCTVCNETVPAERIRLLARRDDLTFIQIDCSGCGSASLEFVADPTPTGVPSTDVSAEPSTEPPPISADEVAGMRDFLADWQGDLRALVPMAHRAPGFRVPRRTFGGRRS